MAATAGLSLTLEPMGKVSQNASSLKPLGQFNQTAQEWSLEGPLQNFVFYADWKSKMAATAGNRLTLDPMGKCSNAFFSETTNMIKAKLYMNVHWMILYKL
jgi:NAD(P)H-flavin reductase